MKFENPYRSVLKWCQNGTLCFIYHLWPEQGDVNRNSLYMSELFSVQKSLLAL